SRWHSARRRRDGPSVPRSPATAQTPSRSAWRRPPTQPREAPSSLFTEIRITETDPRQSEQHALSVDGCLVAPDSLVRQAVRALGSSPLTQPSQARILLGHSSLHVLEPLIGHGQRAQLDHGALLDEIGRSVAKPPTAIRALEDQQIGTLDRKEQRRVH